MKEELIKLKVMERYGKIASAGNSDGCCNVSAECCGDGGSDSDSSMVLSPLQTAENIGYDNDLNSIPESSILGVGCGAPVKFANIQ